MPNKPCNEMTPHEILADSLEMLLSLMGNVQGYMRQFDEPEIQVHAETLDKMADMVQQFEEPEIQVHAETLDKMADMVQRWRDEIFEREVEDELPAQVKENENGL